MSSVEAINYVSKLFSFALLLQCLEMVSISKSSNFLKIWSTKNIDSTFPILKGLFLRLYSEKPFRHLILIQLTFIIISFFFHHSFLIILLAINQLFICLRFRGIFNGGSDMMVFVIATGLLIGGKIGLIYIAIHTCFSYFKAGYAKVLQPSWRSGQAIHQFLSISLYLDIRNLGHKLQNQKFIHFILSYLTLIFELSIPVIFIFPKLTYLYFVSALAFHFVNYLVFGLNRFFWIWLAAWPALIYSAGLTKF